MFDPEILITDLGHGSQYFADKFTNHLVTKIDQSGSMPEHVKLQAQQQRLAINDLAHQFFTRAMNSERYRTVQTLKSHGHHDAASIIGSEVTT